MFVCRQSTPASTSTSHAPALQSSAQLPPPSAGLKAPSREQLSQLLQSSMAGPLVSTVNGPHQQLSCTAKHAQYGPPGSSMPAPALRLHPQHSSAVTSAPQGSIGALNSTSQSKCNVTQHLGPPPAEVGSRGRVASSLVAFSRPSSTAAQLQLTRQSQQPGRLEPSSVASTAAVPR